jgi:hypothetical protein
MLLKDSFKEECYDAGDSITTEDGIIDAGDSLSTEIDSINVQHYNIKELYYPQKFITFHKNVG